MADRMLTFPRRSSAAAETELLPETEAPQPQPAILRRSSRRQGLFLVKGEHVVAAPATAKTTARTWHTREIVAQVEREVAAMAARRNADRLRSPAGLVESSPERDTPWTVIARVLRRLRH